MKLFQVKFYLFIILIFSFKSFSQNKDAKFFKTSKESFVVKSDSIDLDEYSDLIIIPNGRIFERYFEKIGYFKEVISYTDLIKKVNAINKGELVDTNNYKNYYENEKACVTLYYNSGPDNEIELSLGIFGIGSVFTVSNKSTTNLIGITAGTKSVRTSTWDSMMNEVVNYIRQNSKKYKL